MIQETTMPDEIDLAFGRFRAARIEALAPAMLAELTARCAAGEAIGEVEINAAIAAMLGAANAQAFASLEAADAEAEAVSGVAHPVPAALEVFDAWEREQHAP